MATVLASALAFAWVRAQGSISNAVNSLISLPIRVGPWALMARLGFLLGRAGGARVRGRAARRSIACLLAVLLIATGYGLSAFQRVARGDWSELDNDFPYPDRAILARERWHDARNPVVGDKIKLHGEIGRVMGELGIAVVILAGLDGLLLGLLAIPRKGAAPTGESRSS